MIRYKTLKIKLNSCGLIFKKKHFPKWNKTHAWVPTPIKLTKNVCRVFYAGRDKNNHSQIGSFDIDLRDPYKILKISKTPVLKTGKLGCFDDCAVIPSQVIYYNKRYYLFYVGWTQARRIPYIASIGLATSTSLSKKFVRYSEAPIIGRSIKDPIFTASCYIERNKKLFRIFYTSNQKWQIKNMVLYPKYLIKEGYSKNLIDWKFKKIIIKNKNNEIAITRPWIIKNKKNKLMLYSYGKMKNKKNNYKIGLAIFKNKKWRRIDSNLKLTNNIDTFDKLSKEYAASINFNGKDFVFYNGNNFGEEGIGLAIIN